MSLDEFLITLSDAPDESALVFATAQGDIGAGYHVTELRLAEVTGIDCGGVVSHWGEATLQLLDGGGRAHMQVGKFRSIAQRSIAKVAGLGSAPLRVEFAHGNAGLGLYGIGEVVMAAARSTVTLAPDRALCKPAVRALGPAGALCCVEEELSAACGC